MGRIPQRDGKGMKGTHPIWLEMDEAQDYPDKGWVEILETLKRGFEGARWRAHGVTRGVRDYFYKFTQDDSGWSINRYCMPAGTMVYTTEGPIPVEEVEIGTEVFCVDDYDPNKLITDVVTDTINNGVRDIWKVNVHGGYDLETTYNHPYLVLSREGTRRTRRDLRFEWVEAQDLQVGDYVICVRSLTELYPGSVDVSSEELLDMLGDYSPNREVPEGIWRSSNEAKKMFLAGYLMGDGSRSRQKTGQDAYSINTASIKMAKQLRALCHYVGWRTTSIIEDLEKESSLGVCDMWRFYVYTEESWYRQIPLAYSRVQDGVMLEGLDENFVARKVLESGPANRYEPTYDLTVGTSHTYIAEGLVVHNTGMHRPTWTDEERQDKIQEYGSRDHPDYRRNVLGLHGDATNPLFVLHRLMECVDDNLEEPYNNHEYTKLRITNENVLEMGDDILPLLDFPASHLSYTTTWIGMDVGYTNDPSEILVFAEVVDKKINKEATILKLVSRIQLERINNPNQVAAIMWLIDFYKPKAFAMDKTGVGLPLFQDIQAAAEANPALRMYVDAIKGYGFSEKILVDFDSTIEVDEFRGDAVKEAGLYRNVLEYSSDKLRWLVDTKRLRLPWDTELIGEYQGQTYTYDKSVMDMYGRRKVFSKGNFHALDASRMAALGWAQHSIEAVTKEEAWEPVRSIILT
jgi:hypothetical protein